MRLRDLPTFEESERAVNERRATPLQLLICYETPPAPDDKQWRKGLLDAINWAIRAERKKEFPRCR